MTDDDEDAHNLLVAENTIEDHPRMTTTIYGIQSCGTVKKARAWMLAHGINATFVDFRQSPLDADRVQSWMSAFGAKAMRNTSGASFRALPAEKSTWTDDEWVARFVADPMLIKRPVIEVDGTPKMIGFRGTDDDVHRALTTA